MQVAVLPKPMREFALEKLGYNIQTLEPPIGYFPLYHYVSEQHRVLVPELTAVLSELTGEDVEVGP